MEQKIFVYSKLTDMSVEMQSQQEKNMCVLRGRVLLNEIESRLLFIQNSPRGKRSVEVDRGDHCRMVRRPDGCYTLTLRFNAEEKYVRETLIAEVRNMVTAAQKNLQILKNQTK